MKNAFRKSLGLLLAMVMLFNMLPVGSLIASAGAAAGGGSVDRSGFLSNLKDRLDLDYGAVVDGQGSVMEGFRSSSVFIAMDPNNGNPLHSNWTSILNGMVPQTLVDGKFGGDTAAANKAVASVIYSFMELFFCGKDNTQTAVNNFEAHCILKLDQILGYAIPSDTYQEFFTIIRKQFEAKVHNTAYADINALFMKDTTIEYADQLIKYLVESVYEIVSSPTLSDELKNVKSITPTGWLPDSTTDSDSLIQRVYALSKLVDADKGSNLGTSAAVGINTSLFSLQTSDYGFYAEPKDGGNNTDSKGTIYITKGQKNNYSVKIRALNKNPKSITSILEYQTLDNDNTKVGVSKKIINDIVYLEIDAKEFTTGTKIFGYRNAIYGDGNDNAPDKAVLEYNIVVNNGTGQNNPPTDILLSSNKIDENRPAGSTLCTMTAVDADVNDTHTFTLVSGFGDNDKFEIAGNMLRTREKFNYEDKSSYSIKVSALDNGFNPVPFEKEFTISVNNINEAPYNLDLSQVQQIKENQPAGTTVGTLSAQDVDLNTVLSYTVAGGDTQYFSISNGTLLINASLLDYEAKPSYTVRIRVTDNGSPALSMEKTFTINLVNANDAPTDIKISKDSVSENMAVGTLVGNLSAIDQDNGSWHTFEIVTPQGSTPVPFEIVGTQLKTKQIFDYEAMPIPSYQVIIKATDNGMVLFGTPNQFVEKTLTIKIDNVNENATGIILSGSTINENAPTGTTIGTLSVQDPDVNADFHDYDYILDATYGDASKFSIVSNAIKNTEVFNYEQKNQYAIKVKAKDKNSTNSVEQVYTISVTDVKEAPTDVVISNATITEGLPINTTIGMLSATDNDLGETFTYSIVGGAGDFKIVGNKLQNAKIFDFETTPNYTVKIRVTDKDGLTFEKNIQITVLDGAEDGMITLSKNDIDENVIGAVGDLSVINYSGSFTYSILPGNDGDKFTIAGLTLKTNQILDYETKTAYTVNVRAVSGAKTIDQLFVIMVNNINEKPSNITITPHKVNEPLTAEINENSAVGSIVCAMQVIDPDFNDANNYTYSIVSDKFEISGNLLKTKVVFDYENIISYPISITATDNTNPSNTITVSDFKVNINPVNEAPTNITLRDGNDQEILIPQVKENLPKETVPLKTVIGILKSEDPDHDNCTYSIVQELDSVVFDIVGGKLVTVLPLNFEVKNTYSVKIRATDPGGLYFDKVFEIYVTDANDAPTEMSLSQNTVPEYTSNYKIGELNALDPDANDIVTFVLPSPTPGLNTYNNDKFEIKMDNGKWALYSKVELNSLTTPYLTVKVTANDKLNTSMSKVFTVYVQTKRVTIQGFANAEGSPYINKKVTLVDATGQSAQVTYTGNFGEYSFKVTKVGSYKIRIEGSNKYLETYAMEAAAQRVFNITDTNLKAGTAFTDMNVDMVLRYIQSGILKVTAMKGAYPAVNALVAIRNSDSEAEYSGRTDANGAVQLNNIIVSSSGSALLYDVMLTTEEDTITETVLITKDNIAPKTFNITDYDTIKGTVQKNGVAVSNRYVTAINQADKRNYVGFTDAAGAYTINVKKTFQYMIKPDVQSDEISIEQANILAGTVNINFDIKTGLVVKGKVTDSVTNQPIPNIIVRATNSENDYATDLNRVFEATTNANGDYAFGSVFKVGTYALATVRNTNYLSKSLQNLIITQEQFDSGVAITGKDVAVDSEPQPQAGTFPIATNRITAATNPLVQVGDKIFFNVKYFNGSQYAISNIRIEAPIPAGLTLVTENGNNFRNIATLMPGTGGSFQFALKIPDGYKNEIFNVDLKAIYGSYNYCISTTAITVQPKQHVTMSVPGTAKQGEYVTVTGETVPGSFVTIYRNNVGVATTVAKGTSYSVKVMLDTLGINYFKARSDHNAYSAVSTEVQCLAIADPVTIWTNRVLFDYKIQYYQWEYPNSGINYIDDRFGYAMNYLFSHPSFAPTTDINVHVRLDNLKSTDKVYFMSSTDDTKLATTTDGMNYSATFKLNTQMSRNNYYGVIVKTEDGNIIRLNRNFLDLMVILDPSGYVYDENTNERIAGAEVLLQYKVNGNWETWNAEDYKQYNPLTTDAEGMFSWYVPDGEYQILVKKDGYNYDQYTEFSQYRMENGQMTSIIIPPPRTDVNLPMKNTSAAKVVSAEPDANGIVAKNQPIKITYDKPVKPSSINTSNFTLKDEKGLAVAGAVTSNDGMTIQFTPSTDLDPGINYTASIQNLLDMVDNEDGTPQKLPEYEMTFLVDGEKVILYMTVDVKNASTFKDDGIIVLEFTAPVDETTINNAITLSYNASPIEYGVVVNGNIVTITPKVVMEDNAAYIVNVSTDIKGVNGEILKDPFTKTLIKNVSAPSGHNGSSKDYTKATVNDMTGGKVTLNEIIVNIPAGAFGSNTEVSVAQTTGTGYDTMKLISKIYNLTKNKTDDSKKPLTVSFSYDRTKVSDPTKLQLFTYDEATKEWKALSGTVNTTNATVTLENAPFGILALFEADKVVPVQPSYIDMDGHWSNSYVNALTKKGIINGSPAGDNKFKYRPDDSITREEFAKVLVLANGLTPELSDMPFADVDQIADWAKPYVATAFKAGLIKGYEVDGKLVFAPQNKITRAELTTMIGRSINLKATTALTFTDASNIPDWALEFIKLAVEKGIVSGYPDNTFGQEKSATRAEVAKMIFKFMELSGK